MSYTFFFLVRHFLIDFPFTSQHSAKSSPLSSSPSPWVANQCHCQLIWVDIMIRLEWCNPYPEINISCSSYIIEEQKGMNRASLVLVLQILVKCPLTHYHP